LGVNRNGFGKSLSFTRRLEVTYDDASRARWREGDVTFGLDLARSIVVRAQPSWAALVTKLRFRFAKVSSK